MPATVLTAKYALSYLTYTVTHRVGAIVILI